MSNLHPGDRVSPLEATRKLEEQAKRILAKRNERKNKNGKASSS